MKTLQISVIMVILLGLFSTAKAETLWNNGANENEILYGSYYRILDDFYVPGAGWWIDKVEIDGLFTAAAGINVEVVNIRILSADSLTGEPDDSQGNGLIVTSFDETELNKNGIKLAINFQKTFLKGQRYYWIEFEVIDESGNYLRGLRTSVVKYMPAMGGYGAENSFFETSEGGDLAFKLSGQNVTTVGYAAAQDFKLKTLDNSENSMTFNLVGEHSRFKPGLYQILLNRKLPVLYWFDENGKHAVDFQVEGREPIKFSTPLGDYMCEFAPPLLQSFCQDFVACSAYEFCGTVP